MMISIRVWKTAFFLLLCLSLNKLNAQQGYQIRGHINGVSSGMIKLTTFDDFNKTLQIIDSAKITNGSFTLRGKIESPQMIEVKIMPGDWRFRFIIENSTIHIEADTVGAVYHDYRKYGAGVFANISKFDVTGSANFDAWLAYQNDPEKKKFDTQFAISDKAFDQAGNDTIAKNQARAQHVILRAKYEAWEQSYIENFVYKNPSLAAGIYMAYDLYKWLTDTRYIFLKGILSKFTGVATKTVYFSRLTAAYNRLSATQIGVIPPDFTLLKNDSTSFKLSSFAKNKCVMIDFWASWCGPCRASIPHWKKIYEKYHAKGFEIVSVSCDKKINDWHKAMKEEQMPWTQVIDIFKDKSDIFPVTYNRYNIAGIPRYLLLDEQGKVVVNSFNETDIDLKLKEFYGF